MTPLTKIYDAFFAQITDDMYLEITQEQTIEDCKSLLKASLPLFQFPDSILIITEQQDLEGNDISYISPELTLEEVNILAVGMQQIWLQRQITSVETIRQKFTGTDFKMTSQASHLQRLMALIKTVKEEHYHLQVLYSRREVSNDGKYKSTFYKMITH